MMGALPVLVDRVVGSDDNDDDDDDDDDGLCVSRCIDSSVMRD